MAFAKTYVESDLMDKFPMDWYTFVMQGQQNTINPTKNDPHVALTVACYTIVEVFGKICNCYSSDR
jgi:hypothetical protein